MGYVKRTCSAAMHLLRHHQLGGRANSSKTEKVYNIEMSKTKYCQNYCVQERVHILRFFFWESKRVYNITKVLKNVSFGLFFLSFDRSVPQIRVLFLLLVHTYYLLRNSVQTS